MLKAIKTRTMKCVICSTNVNFSAQLANADECHQHVQTFVNYFNLAQTLHSSFAFCDNCQITMRKLNHYDHQLVVVKQEISKIVSSILSQIIKNENEFLDNENSLAKQNRDDRKENDHSKTVQKLIFNDYSPRVLLRRILHRPNGSELYRNACPVALTNCKEEVEDWSEQYNSDQFDSSEDDEEEYACPTKKRKLKSIPINSVKSSNDESAQQFEKNNLQETSTNNSSPKNIWILNEDGMTLTNPNDETTFYYLYGGISHGIQIASGGFKCVQCGLVRSTRLSILAHIRSSHRSSRPPRPENQDNSTKIPPVSRGAATETVVEAEPSKCILLVPKNDSQFPANVCSSTSENSVSKISLQAESDNDEECDVDVMENDKSQGKFEKKKKIIKQTVRKSKQKSTIRSRKLPKFKLESCGDGNFVYAGKYSFKIKDGQFECGHCPSVQRKQFLIVYHIRRYHFDVPDELLHTLPKPCKDTHTPSKSHPLPRTYRVKSQSSRASLQVVDSGDGNFVYASNYPFQQHNNGFKCGLCPAIRQRKTVLLQHIRLRHFEDKGELICQICMKKYNNDHKKSFTRHVLRQHKEEWSSSSSSAPIVPCGDGRFIYGHMWMFKQITEDNGGFSCDICSKVTTSQDDMLKHIRNEHQEPNRSICEKCGEEFKTPGDLKQHQRPVNPKFIEDLNVPFEKVNCRYKCTLCGASLKYFNHFRLHVKTIHENERSNHICEVCGRGFADKSGLKSHLVVHSEEAPFKCDVCGAAHKTIARLKMHRQRHDDLECDKCQRKFTNLKNMNRHKKVSCSEMQGSQCPYCSIRFFRKRPLLNHIKTSHRNVKQENKSHRNVKQEDKSHRNVKQEDKSQE